MGRLIDADVLKKHYAWWNNEEKEIFDVIVDSQPTAYDVDRVDEQILEYYKDQIDKGRNGWDLVDDGVEVRRIVRNGGKE